VAAPAPTLILASRSPQRRAILERLRLDFSVRVSGVEEIEQGDPAQIALENALRKARAVVRPGEREIVIGCDTVVALDGHIYGKPVDEAEACATIAALAGRTHRVLSGLAVLLDGEERTAGVCTAVTFKALDTVGVRAYVATGEWRERSGGYAIQGAGSALVVSVEGDVDNVVGLPLTRLLELCPELRAG
jgi:septum formation protein